MVQLQWRDWFRRKDAVATRKELLAKPAIEFWPTPVQRSFAHTLNNQAPSFWYWHTYHPTNILAKNIITRNLHLLRDDTDTAAIFLAAWHFMCQWKRVVCGVHRRNWKTFRWQIYRTFTLYMAAWQRSPRWPPLDIPWPQRWRHVAFCDLFLPQQYNRKAQFRGQNNIQTPETRPSWHECGLRTSQIQRAHVTLPLFF